jgi:hypothetical protein
MNRPLRRMRISYSGGLAAALLSLVSAITLPTSASASAPPEFLGITTDCGNASSFEPTPDVPYLEATLYNVPMGASPSASGTETLGSTSASFNLGPAVGTAFTDNAWALGPAGFVVAPNPPSWGQAASVTIRWQDGVGGSGTVTQLVGIPVCQGSIKSTPGPTTAMAATPDGSAYWDVTSDGRIFGFNATYNYAAPGDYYHYDAGLSYGDAGYIDLNAPVVGMAARPDGQGYWLLGGDGGVFSFGLAQFYGSTGGMHLNAPVVGIAATPDENGYWLVASDGGVFAYGDAKFDGSMGGKPLNQPIVGMAVDQATGGYWLVASDGGVFSFNAPFYGSTGSLVLTQPIIGIEAAADGSGYRLGARDGGVFSFNLPFNGSYAGQDSHPIVAITGDGVDGYWLLDSCGGIYTFGSLPFYRSAIVC